VGKKGPKGRGNVERETRDIPPTWGGKDNKKKKMNFNKGIRTMALEIQSRRDAPKKDQKTRPKGIGEKGAAGSLAGGGKTSKWDWKKEKGRGMGEAHTPKKNYALA